MTLHVKKWTDRQISNVDKLEKQNADAFIYDWLGSLLSFPVSSRKTSLASTIKFLKSAVVLLRSISPDMVGLDSFSAKATLNHLYRLYEKAFFTELVTKHFLSADWPQNNERVFKAWKKANYGFPSLLALNFDWDFS